jgi:membrane protein DedA with SNARE-associated domain
VQEFLTSLLGDTHGFIAYATVFLILLACGLGVPLPEDISLILGGFLAHKGAANLPIMMGVGFAGILAGDSLIFYFGRRLGSRVGSKPGGFFARIITPEKRARVEGLFARHGQKIVMIARFMPGVRAVTYFTAGSVGMPYWRFIFWDGLAALLSAPVFVFLGYYFGGELDLLIGKLKEGQYAVLAGVVLMGLGVYLWRRHRGKVRARAAAEQVLQHAARVPVISPEAASGSTPLIEAAEEPVIVAGRSRTSELQK